MSAAASTTRLRTGERVEVADVRSFLPDAPTRLGEVVDTEVAQPVGLCDVRLERQADRPRCVRELLADDVGGDVLLARRVERRAAPFVGAVRAEPAAGPRATSPAASST